MSKQAPVTESEVAMGPELEHGFEVIEDPDGGYVIHFPDLPGCMTQVDRLEEIAGAAQEIHELWVETELAAGAAIPRSRLHQKDGGQPRSTVLA